MGALRPAGPRRPDIPRGWWGASWTVPGVRRSSTARPAARHSWNSTRNAGVSWHVQALFRSAARHGTATASSYADVPEHDGAESAAAESAAAESAAAESAAAESAAAESATTGHAGA